MILVSEDCGDRNGLAVCVRTYRLRDESQTVYQDGYLFPVSKSVSNCVRASGPDGQPMPESNFAQLSSCPSAASSSSSAPISIGLLVLTGQSSGALG